MITLQRVELVNFRSISHAIIEPNLDGGMTALAGGNGLGKSSVVIGIVWALYGVAPADVSVKGLRRQGSEGQECRVTVTFEHDGQVVEVTRSLKGRNDTTVAFIKVNGTEITNVSAKTAVNWIENLLGGLDAQGFTTAIAVRQKELDELVKARPAERKKLIERLAGVERMSEAVQKARELETEAKKLVALLPGSQAEVDQRQGEAESAENIRNTAEKTAAAAEVEAKAAADHADDCEAGAKAARTELDRVATIREEVGALRSKLSVLTERAENARNALEVLENDARGGDPASLRDAQDAFDAAKAALASARQQERDLDVLRGQAQSVARALQGHRDALKKAEKAVVDARADRDTAKEAVFAHVAPSDDEIFHAEEQLEAARSARSDAQAEYRRLSAAIRTLTESSHPACPTCNRDMDDPDVVVTGLKTALDVVTREGAEAKTREESAASSLTELRELRDTFNSAAAELATAERALTVAEEQRQAANTAVVDAESDLHSLNESIAAAADESTPEMIEALESRLETSRELLAAASRAAEAAEAIPAQRDTVRELEQQMNAHASDLAVLEQKANEVTVTSEQVRSLETAATAARSEATQQALHAKEMANEAKLAAVAAQQAQQALSAARQQLDAKAEAIRVHQERTATREALEAFRVDRLARIAPELAEVTTDLVARMTNGRYVAVDMDENFTPILTDNTGAMRPVSWLSGGEESIVALALRVGIGEIISGSNGGLLILDEVLTAQDPDRRQAMISAIRDLPGRQILMINHVAEALDIADKGYLFASGDSGETLVIDLAHESSDIHLEHALD